MLFAAAHMQIPCAAFRLPASCSLALACSRHGGSCGSAAPAERVQSIRGAREVALPSSASASTSTYTAVASIAALGAVAAAGNRRKHRAALAKGSHAGKLQKTRSLANARVIVCAGATLPEGRWCFYAYDVFARISNSCSYSGSSLHV